MMTSLNKSRPMYAPLEADAKGSQHWFVTSGATGADLARALDSLSALSTSGGASPLEVWTVDEDLAHAGAGAACAVPGAVARRFDDENELLRGLGEALRHARVGIRVYALGTEPFIWSVRQVAERCALAPETVQVAHSGSLQRRVYCIHCRAMNEGVVTNVVACGDCGRHLLVRDHFSRRLAAYMGVQADAEVHGELPEIEHAYL